MSDNKISKTKTITCPIRGEITKTDLTVQGKTLKECDNIFSKYWEDK